MQRIGAMVVMLCGALLCGVFGAPMLHMHAPVDHQHSAQDPHRHEPLLHVHASDSLARKNGVHADKSGHEHHDATVIDLPGYMARSTATRETPGIVIDAVRAPDRRVSWSSRELGPAGHSQAALYLLGSSRRGPPA